LAHDLTEFVRETEADLLFHHLRRVYFFGALQTDAEARSLTSSCCIPARFPRPRPLRARSSALSTRESSRREPRSRRRNLP
jgi:hypothetical protein